MSDTQVNVNQDALFAMQDLLQDQFIPTLEFCVSEFDRLQLAVEQDIEKDIKEAIRHAHSLKSNAAQFGAESLASISRQLEHALMEGDMSLSHQLTKQLPLHISATKEEINKLV